jgi:glutaminase
MAMYLNLTACRYFQICSILSTCTAMSIMASTLANGGLNPLTGHRIFAPSEVRNALPIMLMAGMYDYSGQWAFDIGVPAKSGVGGCVYVVIPNLCGISIWSPRLDKVGNSQRGVEVCKALVKRLQFHNFEVSSFLCMLHTCSLVTMLVRRRLYNDGRFVKHALHHVAVGC